MVNSIEISGISHNFLPFLIYNPMIAAIFIGISGRKNVQRAAGVISSSLNILVCFHLFFNFDPSSLKPQYTELSHWLVFLNLDFAMGVTGISVLFITTVSIIIFLILMYEHDRDDLKKRFILILILSSSSTGFFSSLNTILMFFFLILFISSFYLYISYYDDKERGKKVFVLLAVSALLFLATIVVSYAGSGSFYLPNSEIVKMVSKQSGIWIFIFMITSVLVMFGLFPFHIYCLQDDSSKSVITNVVISSIVFKIAVYNYIKFCVPFSFNTGILYSLASVALLTFFYSSILAFTRRSVNELFSYIMISHGSIVFAGSLFKINDGITGSVLHIINMGLIIPALFMCFGFMFRRSGSCMLDDNRAISIEMPLFSVFIIFFSLALIGFPVTGTFISELLIVSGGLKKNLIFGIIMVPGLIISALYVLNYTRKMIWGDSNINIFNFSGVGKKDLKFHEIIILFIYTLLIIFNGLFPKVLIDIMKPEIAAVLKL